MHMNWNIRPELASVCRFISARRAGQAVRTAPFAPRPDLPLSGVLGELARLRGL